MIAASDMSPTEEPEDRCLSEESVVDSCAGEDLNSGSDFGSETESEMDYFRPDDLTYINDPVHGMLEIHPLCKAVIDTPEFQRLRYIKQCGLSNFVYPGALHTRFDHSLGVCYLALRVVNKLRQMDDLLSIEESLCVQLAALCHDLGHGPFSHSWEQFIRNVVDKPEDRFKHEEMSVLIFDYMIKNNSSLKSRLKASGINETYLRFIKALILGNKENSRDFSARTYLFEIVANKENGLDIDKYEYLLRDSYFFGIKLNTDFERYLTGLKIVHDDDEIPHIGYRDKLKWHILHIFQSRAEMHNTAYKHRVCLCLETMLMDVLLYANDHLKISTDGENSQSYKLSECHRDVKAMLQLTDRIFETILFSKDESLSKARHLIQRIFNRDLYAEVLVEILDKDEKKQSESSMSPVAWDEKKFEQLLKFIEEELSKMYKAQFRCRVKKLELGQSSNGDNTDPLRNVWFVSKDRKRYQVDSAERDPSLWLPHKTRCTKLYLFCDKKATKNMKSDAKRLVGEHIKSLKR